jgi:asparagine synthase (glutamine-hydrolysing)
MLAFASEAKALFEIPGVEREVNPNAVVSSLLLLWVPEPETGFRNVFKLEPGHYALFEDGNLKITQYWDVPVGVAEETRQRSEGEYVEELRHRLEVAVERQMISDVPVGAFLSGGLDSSLIVALMRRVNSGKISTYTIEFSARDKQMEAMPDDARYAAIVARQFGTDHQAIDVGPDIDELLPNMLWHLDDPVADGASINTYLIAKGAREAGTTVLLNGMGGDEVFGGYRKQLAALVVERYMKLPGFVRRGLIEPTVNALPVAIGGRGIRTVRWAKKFLRSVNDTPLDSFIHGFTYFNFEEFQELASTALRADSFEDLYPIRRYRQLAERVKGLPLVDQMTYLDTKLFLPGINLIYSDKATMAASVEGRPPLIDVDLVEFASRLPAHYKINGRVQKYLLKRAAEAYLPKEIIYRPKAAFGTPIRAWMKRGLADEVREEFSRISTDYSDMLRPGLPERLLQRHIAGSEDNAHRLWALHGVINWLDINRQQTSVEVPDVYQS